LVLSRKAGDKSGEAWSLLYKGYAHLLFNDVQRAEEAFRYSAVIRNELGQPGMRIESITGLIQTLSLKGDAAALSEAENVASYLQSGNTLDGAEAPLRVYYTCYLVLEKAQDPRASTLLHSAVQLLETQVSKLRDEESRRKYVENVPWRSGIRQAWQDKFG
jgi:hypothetical protein